MQEHLTCEWWAFAVEIVTYSKSCLDWNLNMSLQSSGVQQMEPGMYYPGLTLPLPAILQAVPVPPWVQRW